MVYIKCQRFLIKFQQFLIKYQEFLIKNKQLLSKNKQRSKIVTIKVYEKNLQVLLGNFCLV